MSTNSPTTKDDLLLSLMRKHGFVLPRNAIEWRVVLDQTGKPLRGSLPSLSISTASLLCTDGIVAYFLLGDDSTLFFGHLAAFEKAKEARASLARGRGDAPKKTSSPRKSSVEAALALLADFVKKEK